MSHQMKRSRALLRFGRRFQSSLCNKMSSRHCRNIFFFFFYEFPIPRSARAENRSARSPPSNTLVIPSGRRAVMNVSGDSRQRGMPPATNNAALFIGAASNPDVSVCASVTFRRYREREREAVTTPLARNSFLPCPIQPIAFFVLRGMPLVRSNARVWRIIARQILARSFCVARLSETGYVPRVAPEQFADIGSYGYAFNSRTLTRNSYIQLTSIFPLYVEYLRDVQSISKENGIDSQ